MYTVKSFFSLRVENACYKLQETRHLVLFHPAPLSAGTAPSVPAQNWHPRLLHRKYGRRDNERDTVYVRVTQTLHKLNFYFINS